MTTPAITADEYFAIVPESVLFADISAQSIRVYAVLRRYADRDLTAFPSHARIAEDSRSSVPTVKRAIRELVDAGFVEVRNRVDPGVGQTSNVYHILTPPQVTGERGAQVTGERYPRSRVSDRTRASEPEPLEPEKDLKAPDGDSNPNQPTHDQMYLAEHLTVRWGQHLSPAAIVKLNKAHGRANVEGAMRLLRGFPPEEAVESLFAYIGEIASQDRVDA